MNYLEIDPREIKFAGAGAKLQWGMVIGIAIDAIPKRQLAAGPDLLSEIKTQLAKPGVLKQVGDPSGFSPEQKAAVDGLLKGAGSKLSSADLQKAFVAAGGAD